MTDNPIVSEVRKHRTSILESHGGDVRRYHAALQQDQARRFGAQLVILEPHRIVDHRLHRTAGRRRIPGFRPGPAVAEPGHSMMGTPGTMPHLFLT